MDFGLVVDVDVGEFALGLSTAVDDGALVFEGAFVGTDSTSVEISLSS